ncbi:MAG: hypothetical protein ACE37I_00630 [Rubinisphaera brasiliensis]|uniref:Uncharacterized protein n=1 Tax=Rubinisphaera brasiliensis (strain ATCC 49424 / DSM 5305 / JCM 21570 / IAM 15109 / NBRC 103401 / IFAM 1448) TaxID=756272 RepID=F0SFK6_RUBBR|nr:MULTISPECIES: hypothetical protein [Rubinisphaera]ADY60466.1 hypothetical protein Plabr_2867 [Rubinisphaera brasiliensis DSM 5305]MBR9802392.1 hypothetical protein [bacterium]
MVDSIESMTLREKLSEADRLMREMIDHLDNGFVPKARSLSRMLQEHGNEVDSLSDMTVRQQAAELIDANRFSERLYEKIGTLLVAIDRDVTEIQENA